MTRFKSFGSPASDKTEPISFELYGETFRAVPVLQGKTLMRLIAKSDTNDAASSAGMIMEFFEEVLDAESLGRFNELTDSKDKIVPVETLAEIVGWLVEEYSARPEERREG